MSGIGTAADWLEFGRPSGDDTPLCAYHRSACGMGTEPLSELYVLIVEAKRRAGEGVPPLDEHRAMTPAERAQDAEEFAALLAAAQARNAEIEAQINVGGDPWT